MKVGDLVKLTPAPIGVPENSIGLIIEHARDTKRADLHIFVVQLLMRSEYGFASVRRLSRDLEVISESR